MLRRWMMLVAAALLVGGLSLMTTNITRAEYGTNWTAQYYDNANLSGDPAATQTGINGINFNWGDGEPISGAGLDEDNFSIRFSSTQTFAAGTYEFVVASDDGVRVFIDGALVLDRWVGRPLTTDRFQQTLSAGNHNLVVEYFEGIDQASIQFQWFLISGSTNPVFVTPVFVTPGVVPTAVPVVPTAVPPTSLPPIPPGALTATVINAQVLRVRNAPIPGAPQIGRILRGQTYQVLGRDENARWFLLQLGGYQGWAMGFYLYVDGNEFNAPVVSSFVLQGNPAALSSVIVQARVTLRLRAAPTTASEQIGRVAIGDVLPLIGRTATGNWYQTVYKGTTGWVSWAEEDWLKLFEGDLSTVPVVG